MGADLAEPVDQIERPERFATTAGSLVKRWTATARSVGTGALGASSAESGAHGAVVGAGEAGGVEGTAARASGPARADPWSSAPLHAAPATSNTTVSAAAVLCLIPR